MFKATHKRRATTLSKTLLTAGLLGGAALSTLGAGSAQAAWDPIAPFGYICTIAPTLGGAACEFSGLGATTPTTVPIPTPPDKTTYPNDKLLTLLDQMGLRSDDTIRFTKQSAAWEFNLDFSLDRVAGDSGSLDYKIEVTDPLYTFNLAALSTLLTPLQPFPLGDFVVTKSIYSDPGFSIPLLTLTNNEDPSPAGTLVANGPLSATTIYVRDTWSIAPGSNVALDAIQNNYTQNTDRVPGPLPLLGAGAAFGFSRRIRSRIKGARQV
jgi:hypothetical protein